MSINNYLLSCYRIQDEGIDATSTALTEELDHNQVVGMHTVVVFQVSTSFNRSLTPELSFAPKK